MKNLAAPDVTRPRVGKDHDQSRARRSRTDRSASRRGLLFEPDRPDSHGHSQPARAACAGRPGNHYASCARTRTAAFFQAGFGGGAGCARASQHSGAGAGEHCRGCLRRTRAPDHRKRRGAGSVSRFASREGRTRGQNPVAVLATTGTVQPRLTATNLNQPQPTDTRTRS
jgi:hypothetical protein